VSVDVGGFEVAANGLQPAPAACNHTARRPESLTYLSKKGVNVTSATRAD
jgi:hypothetical protein